MANDNKELLLEIKKLNSRISGLETTIKSNTDSQESLARAVKELTLVVHNLPRDISN